MENSEKIILVGLFSNYGFLSSCTKEEFEDILENREDYEF